MDAKVLSTIWDSSYRLLRTGEVQVFRESQGNPGWARESDGVALLRVYPLLIQALPDTVQTEPSEIEKPVQDVRELFEDWWKPLELMGVPKRVPLLTSAPAKDLAWTIWEAAVTQHEQARGVGVERLEESMREDSNDTQLAIVELACSLGIDAEQRWDHDSCPNNGDIIREITAEWELVPCDSIRCHEGKLTRPCPICNDFKTHLRRRINTKEEGSCG